MHNIPKYLTSNWFLFIVIVLVNFLLRVMYVGLDGYWFDEALWVDIAENPVKNIILISAINDPNPPLYPVILHFWIKLFGHGETGVRMLTVIATSLAGGVLFLLARRFFNFQAAIFVSFLFFTSNELFYYAQEARPYALIILFALLSYYFYLALLEKPAWINAIMLGILNSVLFYLHLLSVFCIIGQVLAFPLLSQHGKAFSFQKPFSEYTYRINLKVLGYYILSWLVFILLFLPWKKRFFELAKPGAFAIWQQKPNMQQFKQCIYDFFNTKGLYQAHIYSFIIFLLVLILFKHCRDENFSVRKLIFALIIGPGLIYLNYFLALHTSPIFLKRYVLFTILGFMLTYAYVFSAVKIPFYIKLAAILVLSMFSFRYVKIPRETIFDYKTAAHFFKGVKSPNTLIANDLSGLLGLYLDESSFAIKEEEKRIAYLRSKNILTVNDKNWAKKTDFSPYRDVYYAMSFEGYSDPEHIMQQDLRAQLIHAGSINCFKGIWIMHFVNPHYKKAAS